MRTRAPGSIGAGDAAAWASNASGRARSTTSRAVSSRDMSAPEEGGAPNLAASGTAYDPSIYVGRRRVVRRHGGSTNEATGRRVARGNSRPYPLLARRELPDVDRREELLGRADICATGLHLDHEAIADERRELGGLSRGVPLLVHALTIQRHVL